jgi:hypothetical protein
MEGYDKRIIFCNIVKYKCSEISVGCNPATHEINYKTLQLGMTHDKIMLNFLDKHKIKYIKKVYNSDHRFRNIRAVMEFVILL